MAIHAFMLRTVAFSAVFGRKARMPLKLPLTLTSKPFHQPSQLASSIAAMIDKLPVFEIKISILPKDEVSWSKAILSSAYPLRRRLRIRIWC
jgi:hypothetical protein